MKREKFSPLDLPREKSLPFDIKSIFLFEVSWEVCNKVGGIYTVIRSKLKEAIKNFGENYILIGPNLEYNRHFIEISASDMDPFLISIVELLKKNGIRCRVGNWDTDGMPKVILVNDPSRYKVDELLYRLWSTFGIDSLASNYEYIEPLLFATLSGEVIRLISEELIPKNTKVIAQFHEWLCGAGLLYLKQYSTDIATVFTTHATVLGRALAQAHRDIYNLPDNFDPNAEAHINGVSSKHLLEVASAQAANCFTTVGHNVDEEAYKFLNKYPDILTLNGLDIEKVQHQDLPESREDARRKVLSIARRITKAEIPDNAKLWITSGRYEFHNKGFDLLLKSLALLDKKLTENSPHIVVLLLVAANNRTNQDCLYEDDQSLTSQQRLALGISTHKINNPYADPIIRTSMELNLLKDTKRIHLVFSDAYLNGNDGVFDLHYESILAACDLGVFPSYYEPWGYTPLESIAYGVPTITSDHAGFGVWVKNLKEDFRDAVYVLEYKNREMDKVADTLCDYLGVVAYQDPEHWEKARNKTRQIARLADWKLFYKNYLDAYAQAIEFNQIYYAKFGLEGEESFVTSYHEVQSANPRFRVFQHECKLPAQLSELRDLAYNLWWSWNDHSLKQVFADIDNELWDEVHQNPISFLNQVSSSALAKKVKDSVYMKKYNDVVDLFQGHQRTKIRHEFCDYANINENNPIVYFCLEYGLDSSLPIYSGGLGILAGDYLKTISDMDIPLVAIGLFYKQGYFVQKINSQGEQVVEYLTENPNHLPMKQFSDTSGEPLIISMEAPERTIYATVWEVKVGKINLYLLDTDIAKNTLEDRQITAHLYGGAREYRLMQEVVLGIGGARFVTEHLKVTPAIYHLNEGHSGFLLLERFKDLYNQGRTQSEAFHLIRASSVFTTHTSVPAGNEVFADDMIVKYFAKPAKLLGFPIERVLALAKSPDNPGSKAFSLTAFAMHFCYGINAVSKIHGDVVKSMWKSLWPSFLERELPILSVTNGVHLPTWLGPELYKLYDKHLGQDWIKLQGDRTLWEKVADIPDRTLWNAHQSQKEKLLEIVRKRIIKEYTLRNENKSVIDASLACLNPNTLVIGLSRRFATYKRHNLILRNQERLAKIMTNEKRPVILLVAGKAHPADGLGQKVITSVLNSMRLNMFKGQIVFLENYDINLAKALVQGVDVWLNTPIINTEACGTSGMKVGMNGGLNFSIKDGWWAEAFDEDPNTGWDIENFVTDDTERRDEMENIFMLDRLEYDIAPLYYGSSHLPKQKTWIERMKAAITLVSYQFNTQRMVKDYFEQLYCPLASYYQNLSKNSFVNLRTIIDWKVSLSTRFNTVKIKTLLVDGIKDGKIRADGVIRIKLLLFSGKMTARELKAQLILVKSDGTQFTAEPIIVELGLADEREIGILTYTVEYKLEDTGFYSYGMRVLPWHPLLYSQQDIGMALWA